MRLGASLTLSGTADREVGGRGWGAGVGGGGAVAVARFLGRSSVRETEGDWGGCCAGRLGWGQLRVDRKRSARVIDGFVSRRPRGG